EYLLGTAANNPDTDGDGMPDGWEVASGLNATFVDAGEDHDGDGLDNIGEYLLGTAANNPDTDGDGMPDGWEVASGLDATLVDSGEDADVDGLNNLLEYLLGTTANNPDTDGDGMPDGWEFDSGTDPVVGDGSGDLDGDGLPNLQEYIHGCDPADVDSDGDGFSDGVEVRASTDPLRPGSSPLVRGLIIFIAIAVAGVVLSWWQVSSLKRRRQLRAMFDEYQRRITVLLDRGDLFHALKLMDGCKSSFSPPSSSGGPGKKIPGSLKNDLHDLESRVNAAVHERVTLLEGELKSHMKNMHVRSLSGDLGLVAKIRDVLRLFL
ncbi:MAG: hypothetical protein ACTSU9_08575, partial [Promethearchaeota archaeon]